MQPDERPTSDEPGRRRVRKRIRPRRRQRRRWMLALGGFIVVLGLASGLLVRDVLLVREALQAAGGSMEDVRAAAGAAEIESAITLLDRADAQLSTARSRSGGPLWSFTAGLPFVGDSIEVTREVVAVASATVAVAEPLLTDGAGLVDGGLQVEVDDGRLELGPLLEARALLGRLPLDRLVDAHGRLERNDPVWIPAQLREGRATSLEIAWETITTVADGRQLLDALPGFLGADTPRRYLLGMQSPAELRGTGGLLGYVAVLAIDDGRFALEESQTYDALEDLALEDSPTTTAVAELAGDVTDTVSVPTDFLERYEHTSAAGFFSNVNVDPDVPTTAEVALDLFEARLGDRLDGMILVDPLAMTTILTAVGGDLEMPAVPSGGGDLPSTLSPDRFAQFTTIDIYEHLGDGRHADREPVLRGLADASFAQVFDTAWDGVAVARAVGEAASERHLQLYSRDEDEQLAFGRIGVTGELAPSPDTDLLAVTANNAVGGKQDVHLGHMVSTEIALDDPRRDADGSVTVARSTTARVEVVNPLPASGMDRYVIGNCLVGDPEHGCFDGPPGHNRTWFTVWSPGDSMLQATSGDDDGVGVGHGRIHGLQAYDRYLETASRATAGFDLAFHGRAPARTAGDELVYELTWWAQSKAIPTLLDLAVVAPEGWRIVSVEQHGGGRGRGFGVYGDGRPLASEIDHLGRARLVGTVTGHAEMVVHMVGATTEPPSGNGS